jgi:hypothetical protein
VNIIHQQKRQWYQSHLQQFPYPSPFPQAYLSNQTQPPPCYHNVVNQQQLSQTLQATHPSPVYPQSPSTKIAQPQQQSEAIPTHASILMIINGFSIEPNTKRQHRDPRTEANPGAPKGLIT